MSYTLSLTGQIDPPLEIELTTKLPGQQYASIGSAVIGFGRTYGYGGFRQEFTGAGSNAASASDMHRQLQDLADFFGTIADDYKAQAIAQYPELDGTL